LQLISTMRVVCESFANYLLGILSSMEEHTLVYKVVPNAAPLNAADFCGRFARRAARASLFGKMRISPRARFLRKVRTMEAMIDRIADDFRAATRIDGDWCKGAGRISVGKNGNQSLRPEYLHERNHHTSEVVPESNSRGAIVLFSIECRKEDPHAWTLSLRLFLLCAWSSITRKVNQFGTPVLWDGGHRLPLHPNFKH